MNLKEIMQVDHLKIPTKIFLHIFKKYTVTLNFEMIFKAMIKNKFKLQCSWKVEQNHL